MNRDDEACVIMLDQRLGTLLESHPEARAVRGLLTEVYQRAWQDSHWWFTGQLLVTGKSQA